MVFRGGHVISGPMRGLEKNYTQWSRTTEPHTFGHGDFMTKSGQFGANSVKMYAIFFSLNAVAFKCTLYIKCTHRFIFFLIFWIFCCLPTSRDSVDSRRDEELCLDAAKIGQKRTSFYFCLATFKLCQLLLKHCSSGLTEETPHRVKPCFTPACPCPCPCSWQGPCSCSCSFPSPCWP